MFKKNGVQTYLNIFTTKYEENKKFLEFKKNNFTDLFKYWYWTHSRANMK